MRALIITVAGMSTRFSESIGAPCLKCLYSENGDGDSLLSRFLTQSEGIDKYIIVGGYRFEELQNTIKNFDEKLQEKIILINNDKYSLYGSGYSLFLGMQTALKYSFEEIVFAEGDLFLDPDSFMRVLNSSKPVITVNSEPIHAKKSVVFYYDTKYGLHYLYDTGHSELYIKEPFVEIHNSGQVWKFWNNECMRAAWNELTETDWQGTNLVFIQNYFSRMNPEEYEIIRFDKWINCNTVHDFRRIKEESLK